MDANGATFSGSPLTPEALQRLAQSLVPVLARELSSGSNAPMSDGREHGRYDGDAPPAPRNTSYVPFYSPRPNAPSVSLPFMIPVLGDSPQEAARNTANKSTGASTVPSSAPISSIPASSPPSSLDSSDIRCWEHPLSDDLCPPPLKEEQIRTGVLPPSPALETTIEDLGFTKHEKYFFPDGSLSILVEDTLFKVHLSFLIRDSALFESALSQPKKGMNGFHIATLDGIKAVDFERFLGVIYPSRFDKNDASTFEEWSSILHLATKWGYESIRSLAIREIFPLCSPIDKIVLGREYDISDWLRDAYILVCERREPITLEEARRLGLEEVVKISKALHELCASPVEFILSRSEVEEMVDQVLLDLPAAQGDDGTPHGQDLGADKVADSLGEGDCSRPASPISLSARGTPTNPSGPADNIPLSIRLCNGAPFGTPRTPSLQCPELEPLRTPSPAGSPGACFPPSCSTPPSAPMSRTPSFAAPSKAPSGWRRRAMLEQAAPPPEEKVFRGWGAPKTKKMGGKGGGKEELGSHRTYYVV
ncbi:hypothetical protein JAAARDRAFT_651278 [Jaapia argillacea MUCL 33604]|uniref:BTB domain-containing protein n=1 Tax=Jaapia argillacea MUCL 33604 TaxID=933084 RepID=A0A067Q8X7_9AGAM|nr:hypothetical protein JAAARDRAFT_651278 [Jaapia argillacea MUCL 33604]